MPPKSAIAAGLQNESTRLASFTNGTTIGSGKKKYYWPHDPETAARTYAEAGFYYTPTKASADQVTCFWCGKKEKNLQEVTDIVSLHLSHNPQCPYATIYRYLKMFQACENGTIAEFLEGSQYSSIGENLKDPASFWRTIIHEMSLPDTISEPHCDNSVKLRLATFSNLWKFEKRKDTQLSARQLASSGFFYAPREPNDDRVICMYCGCPLSAWDLDDDPLQEHINNSRQFRGNRDASQCFFLHTRENHDDILERNTGAELQHIPSDADSTSYSISAESPKKRLSEKEKESSPLNDDMNSLEGLLNSPQSSDVSDGQPSVSSTPKKPTAQNDSFDISIEQLSDHGTYLDRENQHGKEIRRYPRRNRQPVSYKNSEFKAHTILKMESKPKPSLDGGPKKKEKPDTSLILEVSDAGHKSDHDSPSAGSHSGEMEMDPTIDPEISHLSVNASSHVMSSPDGDSSNFQQESSTYIPQDSEDGDFVQSIDDSSPEKSHNSEQAAKPEKLGKLSKSLFSDDEFGIDQADFARILKSPKKERKLKVVKKVVNVAPPAFQDISDQNLGDYDEKNLSFIEKDIKVHSSNQDQSKPDVTIQKTKESSKKPPGKKSRFSFSIKSPKAVLPGPSTVEASKSQKNQSHPEHPEKVHIGSDIEAESTVDIQRDADVGKIETEDVLGRLENTDDDVILDASPQGLQTIKEASSEEGNIVDDDDMQLDYNDFASIDDTFGTAHGSDAPESEPNDERNSIIKKEMVQRKSLEEAEKTDQNEAIDNGGESTEKRNLEEQGKLENVPVPPTPKPQNSPKFGTGIKSDSKGSSIDASPVRSKSLSEKVEDNALSPCPNGPERKENLESANELPESPLKISDTKSVQTFGDDQKSERHTADREYPSTSTATDHSTSKKRRSSEIYREDSATKKLKKTDKITSMSTRRIPGDAPFRILDEGEVFSDGGSPTKISNAQEGSESPEKELVISPSSYREYMTDYAKMADEFDSVARESEADVTRQSEVNMEDNGAMGEVEPEHIGAEVSQKEGDSAPEKKTDPKEDKPAALNATERRRPSSFIGDSVSEIAPLHSEPPALISSQKDSPRTKSPAQEGSEGPPEAIPTDSRNDIEAGPSSVDVKSPEANQSGAQLTSEHYKDVSKSKEPPISSKEKEDGSESMRNIPQKADDKQQAQIPDDNERLSFSGIEASTPNKTAPDLPQPTDIKPSHISMEPHLAELQEIDETIDYVLGLASQGYELHDDVEGELTDFISKMPEEEEEMTVTEWIRHNAAACKRAVEEKGEEILAQYETGWDELMDYVENLDTVD